MAELLRLSCAVQNYAWGKRGRDSEVVKLKESDPCFELKDDQPYAELWMGTHSKGPSIIDYPPELKGLPLSKWLLENKWSLGDAVCNEFCGELPFLFKVLSINKALSIQAHPTKDHAQVLHDEHPDHYPDSNHKPEMVIALSPFEGLCSFRPFSEIQSFIRSIPELQTVLGTQIIDMLETAELTNNDTQKQVLKTCFTALMKQDAEIVKTELRNLMDRIQIEQNLSREMTDLFVRLHNWFPGDVGCWCCFFLNHIHLDVGQSLYLAPNEPHAYIKGDVVECMACSDNVVRAGLTPKFRDKDVLCSMLTYNMKTPAETMFPPKPHPHADHVTLYDPPTPEFAVAKVICSGTVDIEPVDGPSILLIQEGSGHISSKSNTVPFVKGNVFFVPAAHSVQLTSSDKQSTLFHAYCHI